MFTLAVPTEKEDATTTKVVLTVPDGFSIDSFAPAPGWKREVQQTGSGEDAVITEGDVDGGGRRCAAAARPRSCRSSAAPTRRRPTRSSVEQTYSDGSVVDWAGPRAPTTPAPTVEAVSSLGGGGDSSSTLAIVALVVGAIGVVLGAVALVAGGGRELA